jgi:hypothetical protein
MAAASMGVGADAAVAGAAEMTAVLALMASVVTCSLEVAPDMRSLHCSVADFWTVAVLLREFFRLSSFRPDTCTGITMNHITTMKAIVPTTDR